MKISKIMTAFAAVALFASCSHEPAQTEEPEFEGGITSATLVVTVGDSDTRAVQFPTRASTTAEKRIYNTVAVAFDRRGLLETYAEFEAFQQGGQDPSQGIELYFDEITTGAHQFYVIANAPKTLLARKAELFPKGMSLADFRKEVLDLAEVADIVRLKTSYDQGDLDKNTRGFMMTSEGAISKSLTLDGPNNVNVQLVRTVAKISVAFDPVTELDGTFSDVEWRVAQNPNRTYIFPVVENGLIYTPYFNSNYNSNNYIDSPDSYQDAIISTTSVADATFTYAVENTNMTELEGNSTIVHIRGIFTPDNWLDADGNSVASHTGSDFWRLRIADSGAWEPGYYTVRPNNIPTGQEAVKFEDGLCYYYAWLRNSVADQYMVKRNTYVKLTITAIYGAGEPGEGVGVDPTNPIDRSTNASISVQVLDWEDDNQDTEL